MKLQGKAMWASVQTPNTTFDPVYQIDLIIDPKDVPTVKKLGLSVKKTEDGDVVRFRRAQFRKDGSENRRPVVVDKNNLPLTDLIGNGSLVNVQFSTFEWNNKFGSGISSDLQGVQVLELIEFGAKDGDEFAPVDGDDSVPTSAKQEAAPDADFDDDLPEVL